MDRLKTFLISVILFVIVIVILLSVIAGTTGSLITAGDSITDANNCTVDSEVDNTGIEHYYNISDKYCYNVTGQLYTAGQYDLPLNALFSSTGVILLVLMASLLILLIVLTLKFGKQK